jgi:hypothetical protein
MCFDLDGIDSNVALPDVQLPLLPWLQIAFDVAGEPHGREPSGTIVQKVFSDLIMMGIFRIDMEKIPRHLRPLKSSADSLRPLHFF